MVLIKAHFTLERDISQKRVVESIGINGLHGMYPKVYVPVSQLRP